ncbi:MAG: tyrosine-type recombinase/integrase [Chloroflexota bacterium]
MSIRMDMSVGRRDRLLQQVESFFREHLQRTRGASRHTVFSYRDSLQLFFCYLADEKGGDVSKLCLDDITENKVLAFLDHLESGRGNGVATRNSRLTAIRSFCRYLIRKDTTHAAEYGLIVSIAGKKGPKPDIPYLEPAEVKLLLEQANQDQILGLRDYALIQFLYNTGVRVSEALSLSVGALELSAPRQVRVHGKGRKDRVCPLWRSTTALLKRYIARWKLGAESRLFCNGRRRPLTTSGVAYILERHFEAAKKKHPILRKRKITPHVMRHSCACALLQSGVDLVTVRDLLGHESVRTTNRYTRANMKTKRQALEAFWKTVDLSEGQGAPWAPKPELLEILASL